MHIDFMCATSTGHVQTAYSSLLDNELILRNIYWLFSYSVEIKQKYLRLTIRNGQEIVNMRRAINWWCQVGEEKMMAVNDAILCSLHLELRCNEKNI